MLEFTNDHEGVCQGCVEGKHTRGLFPSSITKTSYVLQLVHSNLSGMLPVTSLGGCSYYMTFIDDFSRKTWIYFHVVPYLQSLGGKYDREEDEDFEN